MLELAGWSVQDMKGLDFTASRGVAIREFPLKTGFADYMLFVDRKAVGIVEAKKEGTSLSGVATQSRKYLDGLPAHVQKVGTPLPFAYESTGVETVFRDVRDLDYRSRRVFSFHHPGTLMDRARRLSRLFSSEARRARHPSTISAGRMSSATVRCSYRGYHAHATPYHHRRGGPFPAAGGRHL